EGEKTVIAVEMPSDGVLSVQVLTLDGNVITNLQRGTTTAGTHYYSWNGTNRGGNKVARGLYFVRVVGPGIDETRKVMCVK
nr:T9SS type A sorting domain-containing protein [Treponemataceae bacterium]